MATWDRFKTNNPTGLELMTQTGRVFYPRSYCDDPDVGPVGIYIAKAPTCKLKMTPVIQFVDTDIAWDISQSRSTTGTIDEFFIDWGGTTDIGDLSNQAWASDPKTGNVQYTTVGTYTVEAYVVDLLNEKSKRAKIEIQIVEPVERVYIGTSDSGVFVMDDGGTPTASNSGLSGDDLDLRAVRLNPHYADLLAAQHHVWLATKTGLAYSTDGATTWTKISEATLGTPTNTAGDDPAPASSDLDQIDLAFDPQDSRRLYLLRTTATRAWLYTSADYGASWSNTQIGGF